MLLLTSVAFAIIDLANTPPVTAPRCNAPATYDCDVNDMCGAPWMERLCAVVINHHIWRSDNFTYLIGRWPDADWTNAPCVADSVVVGQHMHRGCSMYIEGPSHCKRTGNQVWWDYQAIKRYGCKSCGLRTFGIHGECRIVVNYDSDCPRRSNQKQGPLPTIWPPGSDSPPPAAPDVPSSGDISSTGTDASCM